MPPPAGVPRGAGRRGRPTSTGTATPTGPPPSCGPPSARCTASGPSRSSPPTARTRCSRRCCLTYGGRRPLGRRVRADLRAARPHRPASPAPTVAVGERADDFALDLDEVAGCSADARRPSRSSARPTTPPGMVEPRGRPSRRCSTWRPGPASWSTRPTGSSRRGRRSSWSTRTRRWSSPAPTPRRGRWPPPASATSSARRGWSPSSRRSCCRTTSTRSSRSPAGSPCDFTRRDGGRGSPRSSRSGAGWSAALADLPCRRVAVGRQLRAVPAPDRDGADGVAGAASTARCSSATARRGPASTAACGSPSAPAPRTTASSPPSTEVLTMSASPPRPDRRRERTTKETIDRRRARPRRADRHGRGDHRAPVLRPHARPARPPRRLRPARARPRATSTSTPTTRSRTSASSLGEAFREALGDKAGVRRFAAGSYPLDEALVEVALDLSGRPFVVLRRALRRGAPARRPAVRPAAGRALLAVVRHRRRRSRCTSPSRPGATPTTSSRPRSRAWPAACATPCGSRARGVPSTKGTL